MSVCAVAESARLRSRRAGFFSLGNAGSETCRRHPKAGRMWRPALCMASERFNKGRLIIAAKATLLERLTVAPKLAPLEPSQANATVGSLTALAPHCRAKTRTASGAWKLNWSRAKPSSFSTTRWATGSSSASQMNATAVPATIPLGS